MWQMKKTLYNQAQNLRKTYHGYIYTKSNNIILTKKQYKANGLKNEYEWTKYIYIYICTSNFSVKDKYHNNTFEKEWKQMIRPVTVKINNII